MDVKDCMILKMLVKEKNITKVAESLYTTQPALTYRIKQLENYFNCKLFIRERTGLRPTPKGDVIIGFAEEMLKKMDTTFEMIELMDREVKGTIKLGVASTYGQYILPTVLKLFLKQYPAVNFNIITGFSSKVTELLETGEVHLAIIRGDGHWREQKTLLAKEPICIVQNEPIVTNQLPDIPQIHYEMDTLLHNLVENWWKDNFNQARKKTMSVDSLETAKEMVRIGMGYAVLPGVCLIGEDDLYIEKAANHKGEEIIRQTWAYCYNQTMEFAAVRCFYEFLVENKIFSETIIKSK